MMIGRRAVVYELNEVPRRVLEDFASHNPGSTSARLLKQGSFFETMAEDQGVLSPWITWSTVHRGVSNEKHCISDFGQDLSEVNNEYPTFTEVLARAGVRVGIFGSLHSYPLPANVNDYAFYVPDTFANGPECFPQSLSAFQDFNLRMVDKSGRNVSSSVPFGPAAHFLSHAIKLGLRPNTILGLVGQLLSERVHRARIGRRRTAQVQIAFDLFMKQLELSKPDFATFFTNHVASSMHRYWPAKFPQDYTDIDLSDEWRQTYRGEIDFTMYEANRQLSRLVSFVEQNAGYILLVTSSMGQAAVDASRIVRSQLFIEDPTKFMLALGLNVGQWSRHRAMLPRYIFKISDHVATDFRRQLGSISINGRPLKSFELGNSTFQIKLGHENLTDENTIVRLAGQERRLADVGMANVLIQDETGSYAYHVPHGILIAYDPADRRGGDRGTISTQEIAPTLLANFGVPRPAYMRPSIA